MKFWASLIGYQLVWFAAVIGAGHGLAWPGGVPGGLPCPWPWLLPGVGCGDLSWPGGVDGLPWGANACAVATGPGPLPGTATRNSDVCHAGTAAKPKSEAAAKRNVRRAIESVAQRLGNTPTICRKCYVHPEILQCYLDGELVQTLKKRIERELAQRLGELAPAEAATLTLLHRRMNGGAKNSRRARPASRTSQASLAS